MSITVQDASSSVEKLMANKSLFIDIGSAYVGLSAVHAHARANISAIQSAYNAAIQTKASGKEATGIDLNALVQAVVSVVTGLLGNLPVLANNPVLSALISLGLSLLPALIPGA